ncbi:MAG: hypothetical protein KME50_13340 [Nostoc desertorum CM1-VF14]|nr:hypothetical protein [Nostoc desertorum CM1-VF14]
MQFWIEIDHKVIELGDFRLTIAQRKALGIATLRDAPAWLTQRYRLRASFGFVSSTKDIALNRKTI